jgi:hypothetical protein
VRCSSGCARRRRSVAAKVDLPEYLQLLAVSAAARKLHALLTAKPPHASYSGEVQEALKELGAALGEESPNP